MAQTTFHLDSNQADRIAWDEMVARQASDMFGMVDYTSDRRRRGDLVAVDAWDNTYIAIEQDQLVVDNIAEAEARYLEAFAKAWDDKRSAIEDAKPRDIYVDADTFLDVQEECDICIATVWVPGIGAETIAYKLRFRAKCQVPTFPSLRVAKGA